MLDQMWSIFIKLPQGKLLFIYFLSKPVTNWYYTWSHEYFGSNVNAKYVKLPGVKIFRTNELYLGRYLGVNVNTHIHKWNDLYNNVLNLIWWINWIKCESNNAKTEKKSLNHLKRSVQHLIFSQTALMSCSVGVLLTAEIHSSSLTGVAICRFWRWNSKWVKKKKTISHIYMGPNPQEPILQRFNIKHNLVIFMPASTLH